MLAVRVMQKGVCLEGALRGGGESKYMGVDEGRIALVISPRRSLKERGRRLVCVASFAAIFLAKGTSRKVGTHVHIWHLSVGHSLFVRLLRESRSSMNGR